MPRTRVTAPPSPARRRARLRARLAPTRGARRPPRTIPRATVARTTGRNHGGGSSPEVGARAGDVLAGVKATKKDVEDAVPGDTGPEHPGERSDRP